MRYFKSLIIIATVITLTSCSILSYKTKYPEPVSYVNKDKFAGTWYEIVGTPTLYNGGCSCSKGVYTQEKSNPNKFKIMSKISYPFFIALDLNRNLNEIIGHNSKLPFQPYVIYIYIYIYIYIFSDNIIDKTSVQEVKKQLNK